MSKPETHIPTRRGFLKAVGLGVVDLVSRRGLGAEPERPNFIFIFTDDQRYDAMGCAGNKLISTPNIDSLAARGVRFDRAFVTLSICSPSRAACLTGRYGSSNGVTTLAQPLKRGEETFAHILKAAGYQTGFVGKWHLATKPKACGFDSVTYFKSNGRYFGRPAVVNGRKAVIKGYIEDYIAEQSIAFLEKAAKSDSPFVLWHCTQVPHMNHKFDWNARNETLAKYDQEQMPVPKTWNDDLSGRPPYLKTARSRTRARKYGYGKKSGIQRHIQRYYAAITEMDASLGRVLQAVKRLGIEDNTWIFFMGDNGWFLGEHGFTSKYLAYEESIRVPFIVAGPGLKARIDGRLVLNIDIPATMLALAGVKTPANMHGRDLTPLLKNEKVPWRKSFLYEAPTSTLGGWPHRAVRTERWKYIRTFDPKARRRVAFEELYDLQTDSRETKNLAADPAQSDRLKQLRDELQRLTPTKA